MATKTLRGVHVFWMIFAFFAVTVSVDVFFIVRAVNTFPGEQVKNSYVLGLDFNREIERRDAQRKRGWTAQAGLVDRSLIVRLNSAAGPLTGLDVEAEVLMPGRGTTTLALVEHAPGEYLAPVDIGDAHRLEIGIAAKQAGNDAIVFEASKTIEVRS